METVRKEICGTDKGAETSLRQSESVCQESVPFYAAIDTPNLQSDRQNEEA